MLFFSLAFQVEEPNQWRSIFEWAVGIVVMLLGAPITQFLKNALNLKDKLALLLTALVAVAIALAELFLINALSFSSFSLENFPFAFAVVFSVATFYYQLLKGSDSILGKRLLLPKTGPDHDLPG
jgi:CHASE2 domain-containing sensor protein